MAMAASVGTSRGANRMRILIVVLVLAVIASLFSGLFFLYKDKGGSNRMVISLTIRVGLSILVFVILMLSYFFGFISPHGIQ
jgi:hypothetical protein